MLGNNLLYTSGKYAESADGMLSCSKAGILASTIAWAADHGIPFDEALSTMTDCGTVRRMPQFSNFFRKRWDTSLELVIIDIKKGSPLHLALRKRLSIYLPAYFLDAVEKAEKEGCLAEMMPRFAKRINFVTDIKMRIFSALSFPTIELVIIILVTSGLSTFIVPKFEKIFAELLEGTERPVFLTRYTYVSNWIFSHFFEMLILLLLFMIIYNPLKPYLKIIFEEIIVRIPFLNRTVKRNALLELAGSMASYLASGKDIAEAAEISAATIGRPWMKKKLLKFAEAVKNGKDWALEWRKMNLGASINDWIVTNSAARSNPAEGFDTMLIWLSNDVTKSSVKKLRWIEISGILFVGLIVASTAIALLGSIFRIIGYFAETF
ncbi:MAG: type II secretion system F family protein [Victivallales bacterium]